jgi:hypothetical protein
LARKTFGGVAGLVEVAILPLGVAGGTYELPPPSALLAGVGVGVDTPPPPPPVGTETGEGAGTGLGVGEEVGLGVGEGVGLGVGDTLVTVIVTDVEVA